MSVPTHDGSKAIELLEKALKIRSHTSQEHKLAEFLRVDMEKRGYESMVDAAGNAVGILGEGSRQLVMMGHMDTVPGDIPVRYEDGCLYGRGAVDAKGPLCAFVLAAARAKQAILASDWQVIVIGATEEEAPYSKGANHAAARYRPDLCIIGEPSGSDGITIGYKGRLLVEADFERGSQHTAAPGPSVSEVAMRLWEFVRDFANEFNQGKEKVFDRILASLRRANSDDTGLLETCKVVIGLRLPVDFGPQEIEAVVRTWVNEAKKTAGEEGSPFTHGLTCHLRFIGHEAAHRSERNTPLAYAFVDAIRTEKLRPKFKLKTGTADFNVVAPIWKCPIVAYGPGDSSLDHTPNEHVPVDEFERGVRILHRAIEAIVQSS